MTDRPYTVLSCAVSLDGYLDSASPERLVLSNDADLDRVDEVRAGCDAILVGAATVRNDNPRLLVRRPHRIERRVESGRPPSPAKVTVTQSAKLDADAQFFTVGGADKLVYCASEAVSDASRRLGAVATVIDGGRAVAMPTLSADLYDRGVRTLLVEGGGTVHTQFLTAGVADELQLVIAPFFVGDSRARRFVDGGGFPWNSDRRARLADVRRIDDVALLRYALSPRFAL
ncbi:MAG: dihydrofolate reductase family protein [Actinomycetia bacterium]|nr:dihydrofolate reductase family protein [Actinomycetes bacterium]